ncbi:MAG: energy transducer TonB [Burkholderiales bacterium]|nr:energy transducer TonB [Burkholderiales bacterium]
MYINNRYFLPLILSVFLNIGVLYALNSNTSNIIRLSSSNVTIGSEEKSLLENMQISMISKSNGSINNTPKDNNEIKPTPVRKINKPLEKPITANQETINYKEVSNKSDKHSDNSTNNTTDSISANSHAQPLVTSKAELLNVPPPISYPTSAIKENAHGKVTLGALINEDGGIAKIKVLKSSGYNALDEAAIKWFSQLKFRPALSGNNKISSNVTQVVSFSLEDAKKNEA